MIKLLAPVAVLLFAAALLVLAFSTGTNAAAAMGGALAAIGGWQLWAACRR